jgi:hypothetical protein
MSIIAQMLKNASLFGVLLKFNKASTLRQCEFKQTPIWDFVTVKVNGKTFQHEAIDVGIASLNWI